MLSFSFNFFKILPSYPPLFHFLSVYINTYVCVSVFAFLCVYININKQKGNIPPSIKH